METLWDGTSMCVMYLSRGESGRTLQGIASRRGSVTVPRVSVQTSAPLYTKARLAFFLEITDHNLEVSSEIVAPKSSEPCENVENPNPASNAKIL